MTSKEYYLVTVVESWNYEIRRFNNYEKAYETYNDLRSRYSKVTLSKVLKSTDPNCSE